MDFNTVLSPKIEKTTLDVSIVHFLLMFGYKLFSLYYPLFLVSLGLPASKVGWVYFIIYVTVAVSSVAVNFCIHKTNPAKIASIGIFGYGVYAFLMLAYAESPPVFYIAQVLLGISAALWLVSLRSIIIASVPRNYNISFGWFYSAPEYASAVAPIVGGLIIYKFGFNGVFILSILIQFANSMYAYFRLRNAGKANPKTSTISEKHTSFNLKKLKENYSTVFTTIGKDYRALRVLWIVFIALVLGGIYRSYFVLFLKDLNYSQNNIIGFMSMLSLAFVPASWATIKFIGKIPSHRNVLCGSIINSAAFIIVGAWSNLLSFIQIFFLMLVELLSGLSIGSGKSAFLSAKFSKFKEEASTIDTVLVSLSPAIGAIVGGMLISAIGFGNTFLLSGSIVFLLASWFLISNAYK